MGGYIVSDKKSAVAFLALLAIVYWCVGCSDGYPSCTLKKGGKEGFSLTLYHGEEFTENSYQGAFTKEGVTEQRGQYFFKKTGENSGELTLLVEKIKILSGRWQQSGVTLEYEVELNNGKIVKAFNYEEEWKNF